jgi:hypothetical protein
VHVAIFLIGASLFGLGLSMVVVEIRQRRRNRSTPDIIRWKANLILGTAFVLLGLTVMGVVSTIWVTSSWVATTLLITVYAVFSVLIVAGMIKSLSRRVRRNHAAIIEQMEDKP